MTEHSEAFQRALDAMHAVAQHEHDAETLAKWPLVITGQATGVADDAEAIAVLFALVTTANQIGWLMGWPPVEVAAAMGLQLGAHLGSAREMDARLA